MGNMTSLWGTGPHCGEQDLTVGNRTSLWGTGTHCGEQDLTVGNKTSLWGTRHHYGEQDITMGNRTSLWGTGPHYGEQDLTMGNRTSLWGTGPHYGEFYILQLQHREHGCITAWYGNCSASDRKALQRVVCTVQYITGAKLPAIQDLYTRRCQRKVPKNLQDPSHPRQRLFSLLTHGKRDRSAKSRSKRHLNSFYPQAIRLLNR
jgi:hypothetical protein